MPSAGLATTGLRSLTNLRAPTGDPLLLITGRDGHAVLAVAFCTALVDRSFMVARFDNHTPGCPLICRSCYSACLPTFRETQITTTVDP